MLAGLGANVIRGKYLQPKDYALVSMFSQTVVSVGAAFRPGGHPAVIRSLTRAMSLAGLNALIFDPSRQRQENGLNDLDHARDVETLSAELGVRLVYVRDVDPEAFLDTGQPAIAVVDLAPEPEDTESAALLNRFDAVWGLSRWSTEALRRAGVEAEWIGRCFEPPEQAALPRRQFGLPGSARLVVMPFDQDEWITPCAEGIHAAYARALLETDPTGDLRIAVMAPAALPDLPDFPDDPRISFHDLSADDYLADSLLSTADCVVSLDICLRVARSLGRAGWMGRPVLAIGQSADSDLPGLTVLEAGDDDADRLAQRFASQTLAVWADGPTTGPTAGQLLTESSHQAVGLRALEKLSKFAA